MGSRKPAAAVSGKKLAPGMVLVFLGLIILPSCLLAYFSWRALENQKLLSRARLVRSYQRVATLAARQIDKELKTVESGWLQEIERALGARNDQQAVSLLAESLEQDPLIVDFFYFARPGELLHPEHIQWHRPQPGPAVPAEQRYDDEYVFFEKWLRRGEDLEYYRSDLKQALETYRRIYQHVQHPQLKGVAKSAIGRVLMKAGEWQQALQEFRELIHDYSDIRDLSGMLLSLWAEYQIAVCLESVDRDREAIEALLQLNGHLYDQSDAINTAQYSSFLDEINSLMPRLLSSPELSAHEKETYRQRFANLAEKNKKRISERFFIAFLQRKLNERIFERKPPRLSIKFFSGEAADAPYLLGVRYLADRPGPQVRGLIAIRIDLLELQARLFPPIVKSLNFGKEARLTIVNDRNEVVIGQAPARGRRVASQELSRPFDFWQVAIYLEEFDSPAIDSLQTTLGVWVISLLLLSILSGAYIFIRRAQREAHLSQLKSTFVSNLSHELRTPLASIKMLAELLARQAEKKSGRKAEAEARRVRAYLEVIQRESDRLSRLIDNLLDFSRIERGQKQYTFEYEDPAAILRMAIDTIRPQLQAHNFTLFEQIADTLPEVYIDADALLQVLLNLLSNAIRYSEAVKEITVRAYASDEAVMIEIADKGIGIAKAEQKKIFDSFYRVDQNLNTSRQGGVGIGLTLVRQIVRDHGGEVRLQSEPGKGSTFTIVLPLPAVGREFANHDTTPGNRVQASQVYPQTVEKES